MTKSKNASVPAQRAWAIMTHKQRESLRKRYRQDPDKDGVPTGFDCRPNNQKRQESFLPADAKFVKSKNSIKMTGKTKVIGEGTNGVILPLKDNNRLVIKMGKSGAWNDLRSEIGFYKRHDMSKLPLMTPMKEVRINGSQLAVIKPVIKPVVEPGNVIRNKSTFTDSRLESLRKKVIGLSYHGYIFSDGFQLGTDKANRLLQFDTGAMERVGSPTGTINNRPFYENNKEWRGLLRALGKKVSDHGQIERSTSLDKIYLAKNRVISSKSKTTSKSKSSSGSKPRLLKSEKSSSSKSKSKKSYKC